MAGPKTPALKATLTATLKTMALAAVVTVSGTVATQATGTDAETVSVYTYHTHPPFITGKGEGLTYDLAALLTEFSGGHYRFTVVPTSRARIDRLIEGRAMGIVPWVNPIWFRDKNRTRYLWSDAKLMRDGNAIVSHRRQPVEYDGPSSLKTMIFGGIKGHVYADIDTAVGGDGPVRRVDAYNHRQNMDKLQRGDIQVMLMPQSGAEFSIATEGLSEELHISSTPHSTFDRRVLIINHRREFNRLLNTVLRAGSTVWQEQLARYR